MSNNRKSVSGTKPEIKWTAREVWHGVLNCREYAARLILLFIETSQERLDRIAVVPAHLYSLAMTDLQKILTLGMRDNFFEY